MTAATGPFLSGGLGVDKKEVAVWKPPEDVTKVQFRHWANAMDIQLEAIHVWKCANYVLNWIKRSDDEIDAKVLEKCLGEAAVDIERDDDIDALGPDSSEYVFAEKTKFLYA